MGISGLLSGGALLGVCGLLSGLIATMLPMWLITRIELHNKLCWTGSGLWLTNFVWGQDIPEMGLVCDGEALNTYKLYCDSPDASDFDKSMCAPTNTAKATMIAAQITGAIALFLAYRVGTKKYGMGSEDYAGELRLSRLLVLAATVTFVLGSIGFGVIYTSRLFSAEHAYEISKNTASPFESSQFGCYFQSPLRAKNPFKAIVKSSPLNCLYGGPSFALAVMSFVCWILAAVFFMIMHFDIKRLQITLRTDPNARVTPKRPIRHPLLTEVLYPRNYSLYGAMSRHFIGSRWRRVVLMALPTTTMLTATIFTVMMLLNGAAVQVFIRLSSPAFSRNEWTEVLKQYPAHTVDFPEESLFAPNQKQPAVVEIIEEVFDFTMLTSIKNFWDGKAYALAILTAVFCAVWPFLRVAIHLFLFFIPVPEQHRGRTLTWLDSLGKWTMVNTFVLCFMGVAFHLHSKIRIKGLLPMSKDLINADIEVSLGPRIATYLFVVGVLLSIVVSEVYIILHRYCRDWEEHRNAESMTQQTNQQGALLDSSVDRLLVQGTTINAADTRGADGDNLFRAPSIRPEVKYEHGFGYEALCDRHQNPILGRGKFQYTPLAKALVWVALGLTAFTTLAGMLQVSMAFTFDGLVGEIIVDERDRRREYSLMSIGTSIRENIGAKPLGGTLLTGVFFLVSFVVPLLRIGGLSVLWFVPMRPRQQRFWFHLLEVLESWSALDVYFVSTLAATLEIGSLSKVILGDSFPAVEELVNSKFPQFGGLFVVHEELLNGMYLILTGVILEKFMSLFIVAQTATAVAERIAEEKLAIERNRMLPGIREENDMFRELEEHPETWAILSPAARYTSASANTTLVYSGLPRFVWTVGARLGLMQEVEKEVAEGVDIPNAYFSLERTS